MSTAKNNCGSEAKDQHSSALETTIDWKVVGNQHFVEKRFRDAVQAYTNGINAEAGSFGTHHLNLLANRSAAYLALHDYSLGLVDAESVLIVDKTHIKCIFRKAKALFGLREYRKSLVFFNDLSLETLPISHQQIVTDLIVAAKSLILQSETGVYQWKEIFRNEPTELTDFMGSIIVKNTPRKGRGLFVTDAVPSGQLIMASKAFAFTTDIGWNDSFVNMSTPPQLITEIARILKENPEKCHEVYNLYAGPEFSEQNVEAEDFSSDIDIKRIEAISFYNGFGNGDASSGNKTYCGLWITPSYINHSCVDGNCSWFIKDDFLFVFAFHNIAKDEEILLSYIPPTAEKSTFFETRDFVCDCRLCIRDRQDDLKTQFDRSILIERLDTILDKYKYRATTVDLKNDVDEMAMILKILSGFRADAPELDLLTNVLLE